MKNCNHVVTTFRDENFKPMLYACSLCKEKFIPISELFAVEQRLTAANGRLEEYEEKTCNCRWEGETLVRQCELHEAHVDAIHEWAERAKVAEQRLAESEAIMQKLKGLILEADLFLEAIGKGE